MFDFEYWGGVMFLDVDENCSYMVYLEEDGPVAFMVDLED